MSDLAALRAAARALDPDRTIAALDRAFEAWRAPESPYRERLAAELEVYSREVLERAFADGLARWNGDTLRALHAREVGAHARVPELVAVWLAGTVPTGVISALALPLLAGSAVYAKPASSDPITPRLFARSLTDADPEVGAALRVDADEAVLDAADALVAYGSDDTIATLRARAKGLFVGYGHKLSVAAIGPETDDGSAAARTALDAALYDGRGCLSPAYVLVDDTPRGRAEHFAGRLAEAFESLRTKLPRGPLTPEEEIAIRELRARASMGGGTRLWLSEQTSDWGVVLGPEAIRPIAGVLRNVPVVPVSGIDGLASWCSGLAPHLSTLGQAGWGSHTSRLADIALAGGGARVCPLGRMQLPPLDWPHDGMPALAPLVRTLHVEEEA